MKPELGDLSGFDSIPDPLAGASAQPAPLANLRPKADSAPRAKVRGWRLTALVLSVVWVLTHLVVFGVRRDLPALPLPYVLAQVLLPLLLAAVSLFVAVRPGRYGLGLGIGLVTALSILGPFSFWLMVAGAPLPKTPEASSDSWRAAFVCLGITLAWAAIPLLAAALCLRNAFAAASGVRSALVGAASGLLAGAIMNLHCSNVDRFHMTAGHAVPVLIAVLCGALLLKRSSRS